VAAAPVKVAKPPKRRRRGGQVGEVFRPEDFSELTTPSAPRFTRRIHPSSARRGMCSA